MTTPHPHDEDVAFKVAFSAATALAIMIVDFLWLIRDEVKYIWPKLLSCWRARIYMLARYVGLASQIYNIYFTVRMYSGVYTSPTGCRIWFTYQAIIVQLLLTVVEGLLMQRLYAMFLQNPIILLTLISFALGQVASMGVSARLSFPSNKHTVTCMMVRSNPGNAFFSATTMTTNMVLFFMAFWGYFRVPEKWIRQSFGWIVWRDSVLSSSAITAMMLFLTLCSLEVIKPTMSGNIIYYWFVCVLWISIGRIIVNHEKIPRDQSEQGEGSTWAGTLQLTSQIEMGQSTLSLDTQAESSVGQTPTSRTLQGSLSTPKTDASQLSSPSTCTGHSSQKWLGGHSLSDEHGPQPPSPQPSSSEPPPPSEVSS